MDKKLAVFSTLLIETSPQSLPLGVACVLSSIKSSKKFSNIDLKLIYQSMEDKKSSLKEKLFGFKRIDYLFLSVFVWNRENLEEIAFEIKKKFPKCIIIAGGPEVTANPFNFKNFDYLISGEGENSSCLLLESLENNGNAKIPGVYKNGEKPVQPILRSLSPDLEKINSPYLDGIINLKEFGGALWELARGCPFKCSYCYESKGEKKIRYFPIQRIQNELELFEKEKISQVFVLDPTYNANKKRALELLNLISRIAPKIFFYFEVRAEFIDRELAKAFSRINCSLQIGLQSSNVEVLKNVNRTFEEKKFKKNIGFLNAEGIIFGFDLIYGLPGDTFEGFRKSIDFALSLYPNNLELFCLSVLPGTDLAEKAVDFNLEFQQNPPYNIIKTPTFSENDIKKSEILSLSCNIFYNEGRAVSWFNSILRFFHKKPSIFLEEFALWFNSQKDLINLKEFYKCNKNHKKIEEIQIDFLEEYFEKHNKQKYFNSCKNLIQFYGALSRTQFDTKNSNNSEEILTLSYYPEDLESPYALDIKFFFENCKPHQNKVKFFNGRYKIVK